jgi:hypothetical protein
LSRLAGGAWLPKVSSKRFSRLAFVLPPLSVALLFISQSSGCKTSCSDPEGDTPEVVQSGVTDATRSVYQSAPWLGEWLEFRPNKSYEFIHGLRGVPTVLQAWVGFHRAPLRDDHNVSEAAGNEAIFQDVTAEHFQVRNDTCETFYLRVVASDPIEESEVGGAGGVTSTDGTSMGAGASGAGN